MLALAAANAVGVVLFGTLYAIAGASPAVAGRVRRLSRACSSPWSPRCGSAPRPGTRASAPLRRLGRIVVGLLVVLVATPAAVLAPLFWLDAQIPVEAGLHAARGGVMAAGPRSR